MSVFASWMASPPPDAAVEIGPASVAIVAIGARGPEAVVQGYAVQPLPPGTVVPSLTASNVLDRPAVVAALREAVEGLGMRPRRIALVIPDLVAKVSLLHFDQIPGRRDDLTQLVRWQARKSVPFPVEEACLTYSPGLRTGAGGEFVAVLAREDLVREYEGACEEAGMYPGLVDLSTLSVINLLLGAARVPDGDWLVVHMCPAYTSVAIMRGTNLIFYRNRPETEDDSLIDVVHQTTMYYQDRLQGQQFTSVRLGGTGRAADAVDVTRRLLEERLGLTVEAIDPTRTAPLHNRIAATPELLAALAPPVGVLLRTRHEAGSR